MQRVRGRWHRIPRPLCMLQVPPLFSVCCGLLTHMQSSHVCNDQSLTARAGAGIMEADDRQVTTVFTVQPSFHHRHSTNRVMKRYRRRRTCSHTSPRRSPTMVTLHDTRFVECRWWYDGWTVKTVVTWRSSASMIPAPGLLHCLALVLISTSKCPQFDIADVLRGLKYSISKVRQSVTELTS